MPHKNTGYLKTLFFLYVNGLCSIFIMPAFIFGLVYEIYEYKTFKMIIPLLIALSYSMLCLYVSTFIQYKFHILSKKWKEVEQACSVVGVYNENNIVYWFKLVGDIQRIKYVNVLYILIFYVILSIVITQILL